MKMRYTVCFLLLSFCVLSYASAKTLTKKRPDLKLLDAYSQRTIPGIPGAPVRMNYYFVLIWLSTKSPGAFLWKGEAGWSDVICSKTSKERIDLSKIRKGDTILISTTNGNTSVLPKSALPSNTLFYKIGSSVWAPIHINKIGKKPDVAMP